MFSRPLQTSSSDIYCLGLYFLNEKRKDYNCAFVMSLAMKSRLDENVFISLLDFFPQNLQRFQNTKSYPY